MQANAQQAAVGMGTTTQTPAQNLVAAGSSVDSGAHILPAQNVFGSYGPMRGGLMDSRNYGSRLSGRSRSWMWKFQCRSRVGQGLHGQGMPGQDCMGTACQNVQASTGRSQEPNQGNASHGMPWMSGQCGGAVCQGQVGSGQNAGMCMGQDIGQAVGERPFGKVP